MVILSPYAMFVRAKTKINTKTFYDQMEGLQRKLIIGGNWKCNGTVESTNKLIGEVLNKSEFNTEKVEVVVAPISIHVGTVKALVNPNVKVAL